MNSVSNKIDVYLKPSTWDFLQDAMWNVVNHKQGTGKLAKIKKNSFSTVSHPSLDEAHFRQLIPPF